MAKSRQDQVYSCRKMDAEFPGSVADGLFRERVPEISHQKEELQDIRGHDSLRERRVLNIPLEMFQKALSLWSDRLLKIHKARGHYVPQ